MNFIFISPQFPHTYWQFCHHLKQNGINVLGIADAPYETLSKELRESLTEYYRVDNMEDYQQMFTVKLKTEEEKDKFIEFIHAKV